MADVPEAAGQLAAELADAFEQDRALAEQLTARQHRLQAANSELWSGPHPDALGLLYDDTHQPAIGEGSSVIAGVAGDAIRFEHSVAEAEAALLPRLQEVHWTIHRAFSEHQRISEDRRQLAAEIGELVASFVAELIAAGWSEDEARDADVHQLAVAAVR